jgi:hypothetical protein
VYRNWRNGSRAAEIPKLTAVPSDRCEPGCNRLSSRHLEHCSSPARSGLARRVGPERPHARRAGPLPRGGTRQRAALDGVKKVLTERHVACVRLRLVSVRPPLGGRRVTLRPVRQPRHQGAQGLELPAAGYLTWIARQTGSSPTVRFTASPMASW